MLKVMKEQKIVGVVNVWNEVDQKFHPDLTTVEDNEHTVNDYVMCGEEYLLREDPRAIEYEENRVRGIRNSYLEQYVDPVCSNTLRWADMSEEEKQVYIDYRRYLLDFTTQTDWYKLTPMTLDEWKNQ